MKKSILFLLIGISLLLNGCIAGLGVDKQGYTIAISPSMITSSIEKEFPKKREFNYGTIELSDPDLGFVKGSDKLNLGLSFSLLNPILPTQKGSIKLLSGIRFDAQSGEFFLKDLSVEKIEFNSSNLKTFLPSDLNAILGVIVSETLKQIPIYKIDKNSFTGMLVKDVKIKDGDLLVTFGI